jgi:hypothetical protein
MMGSWSTKAQLIVPSHVLRVVNINPGVIETFSFILPANPVAEQEMTIITTGAVLEFNLVAGTGQHINLLPKSLAQHACVRYIFIGNTWYCLHSRGTAI